MRWRSDLVSAGLTAILLSLPVPVAGNGSTLDDSTLELVGTLPGWLRWLGQAAYLVGVWYPVAVLVGVGFVARRRLEPSRDMVLAGTLAAVAAFVLTRLINERWPEFAFLDLPQTRATFPAFFVTTASAIQSAASPWLTCTGSGVTHGARGSGRSGGVGPGAARPTAAPAPRARPVAGDPTRTAFPIWSPSG